MDELIESQGADFQRPINVKQIIGGYIDAQLNKIWSKGDIDEFGKSLSDDQMANLLFESLSKDDLANLVRLSRIKKDYFK